MKQVGFFSFVMCVVLFAAGCAEHSGESVKTEAEIEKTAESRV